MITRQTPVSNELIVDRRRNDRRAANERKTTAVAAPAANRVPAADRDPADRRKVERRRQIDPTTCERDYTPEQVEFMTAMDLYKRRSGRQFPTWSEVLEVINNLGYRKVATPTEMYKHAQ